MLKLKLTFLALLLGQVMGWAQSPAAFNKAKMDSLLTVLENKNKLMGTVTLYQDGKLLYNRAIGYASIQGEEKIKNTTATKFRVGSISKTFTATLILQLIEEKKLRFDTPLATFFPQLANAESITVEHLLQQRSGLSSFTSEPAYLTYMTQPKTQAEMLEIMAALKPNFAPGEKYEYSNSNYVLLGYLLEKVTQKPYAEVLKKRIVDKIGLKNTYYGSKINVLDKEASSFSFQNEHWLEMPETDMSIPHGAGSIVSTTQDLALFIQALFHNKLISAASLTRMKTMKDTYGLGLVTLPMGTKRGFGHGGAIDGFSSMLSYFPEQKLTMAVAFNGVATPVNDVYIGILSIAFQAPYSVPTFELPKGLTLDLSNYEGTYGSKELPLKISLRQEGEQLMAQATGQSAFPLELRSETNFAFEKAGIEIEFLKSAAGTYHQFILKQGGGKFMFERE